MRMNVSNMVREGHKQHSCQRRTSLPYELSFPSFKTDTSWSFCFSIWTATFRKSEVFSNLFPFISYCILTLPLSNLHINIATDLLAELPLPKIASFFLISLRGNEKCSESGSAALLCMDVKISEAVHLTQVGWVCAGAAWYEWLLEHPPGELKENDSHACSPVLELWAQQKYGLNCCAVCLHVFIDWLGICLVFIWRWP